jgi:hypothetical protein
MRERGKDGEEGIKRKGGRGREEGEREAEQS